MTKSAAAKSAVWIDTYQTSTGFQAVIRSKAGVHGCADGKTREEAVENVSRSLRKPIPPVRHL